MEIIKKNKDDLETEYLKYKDKENYKKYIITDNNDQLNIDNILKYDISDFEVKNYSDLNLRNIIFNKTKETLTDYIMRHYVHFSVEEFMNSKLFHKKIIYDFDKLKNEFPIEIKEIGQDTEKELVDKLNNIIKRVLSEDIISKKSEDILKKIQDCLGDNIYEFLMVKRKESIKSLIQKKLKKICEHIICFYLYQQFFLKYFLSEIQNKNDYNS